ncbi:RagB/SusD family nutrient uptake outer membrane protein [Mucilaginibacter glaciei]|uniref:RagB/SusD family nutrient uptake outer membrane protein n=1 Tax=Mucilaginibacter glaciei TaxID=2772109 RepID=A0A926NPS9_9SPHI|nr:RagB/SusD family nutrient uptake outer membrane protein [Mucilaginibacter glaciei]MBD1391665.1 RagB/SusD family nutrient uptake outer membrane protein [Mucilaginibacter glaciei]
MKRYLYITLAGGLLLSASSCKKVLDQPPLGTYQAATFFNSTANAKSAVNAAYVPLSYSDAFGNEGWVLGDVASDDAVKGGLTGDQADIDNINNFNILNTNSAVESVWGRSYNGISKANFVLDGLPDGNKAVPDADKATINAQAKFLRAYYYFTLANAYGNIPLRLQTATADNLNAPAVPQAQVYAQIEKDCTEAAAALPTAWTGADLGRATKGAALALLAKTYLFEAKYTQAAQTAQQVEALGYALTNKFTDNFSASTKNNTEAIFSIQHTAGLSPKQGNALNQAFAPRGALNGYGFFQPTQSLVDNFEKSPTGVVDPRLDYTVGRAGKPYFDSAFDPSWTATGYVTKKYIQPLSEIPVATKGDGNVNVEVLRFADVLLIEAEAFNEANNPTAALVPLNKVRKRARESYIYDITLAGGGVVPAGLLPDITTTNQTQLRDIIRKERRSELALEFGRYYDIIRYGSAYATNALKDIPNFSFTANKFFPIPFSEVSTNKLLVK